MTETRTTPERCPKCWVGKCEECMGWFNVDFGPVLEGQGDSNKARVQCGCRHGA